MTLYLDCPACGTRREMERPPCSDGHQAGCPDRACVECDAALVVDPILPRHRRQRLARAA
jgi:hypothetical protein